MLKYNFEKNVFEGDDDDTDVDDDADIMTIDDLIDNSEVDPDDASNYCEDFIPGK